MKIKDKDGNWKPVLQEKEKYDKIESVKMNKANINLTKMSMPELIQYIKELESVIDSL